METKGRRGSQHRRWLKRELIFWRIVGVAAVAVLCFGFVQNAAQREIRLVSPDGRQSVELTPFGISFVGKGKTLGRIGFETIGDGDDQEVLLKITGQVIATTLTARNDQGWLSLNPERIGFVQKGAVRGAFTPDGISLQDKSGQFKISIYTPDQGTGGLDFIDHGKLVLGLGAVAHFRGGDPPRRDAGAIHIGDFGPDPKSRLITAGDSELHTTH